MKTVRIHKSEKSSEISEKMRDYVPTHPPLPREAAVLCLLTEAEGEASVVFEVRSRRLSHQPGEICFPGGGMEEGETPLACALRETEEELGIPSEQIRILAALDTIVHASGQRVHPFLAVTDRVEGILPQKEEVAEVFTVPLSWFAEHPPKRTTYTVAPDVSRCPPELSPFLPNYRRERPTVIWTWEDKVIWGMTAKILNRLLECLI